MSRAVSVLLASFLAARSAGAEQIVCAGVLGNSGEAGDTLVRFGPVGSHDSGLGVVYDRLGSLWDRAGKGTLNRYAPDGRLLAQYRIPDGGGGWQDQDAIALAGDTIVMKLGRRLYTLSVTAPPGSEPNDLGVEAERMSLGSANGRVAAYANGKLFLLDAETGRTQQVAESGGGVAWLELGPDEAVYAVVDWKMHKFVNGQRVRSGWPRDCPGERPQLLDGVWFGHGWHGTVRRFDAELQPAPGVVLGGASGSFIGHLDQNSELVKGSGMARLAPRLYAISGIGGIMHLAEWDASARRMTLLRRIGAVPVCRGLGLDRSGNVWFHAGSWKWDDRPDEPLRFGVNAPEHPGVGQAAMLDSDCMVAAGWLWGKPTFYRGPLGGEVRTDRIEQGCALSRAAVAATWYRRDGKLVFVTMEPSGAARAFFVGEDGAYRDEAGAVEFRPAVAAREWAALARVSDGALLGAADGAVVEFAPEGPSWKETRRWNSWGSGPDERFGPRIRIAADDGRLWVADTERHRVLCFDLATRRPLASFGRTDAAGTDLGSLSSPGVIAARARRAVVHDAGNQRLVRLELR